MVGCSRGETGCPSAKRLSYGVKTGQDLRPDAPHGRRSSAGSTSTAWTWCWSAELQASDNHAGQRMRSRVAGGGGLGAARGGDRWRQMPFLLVLVFSTVAYLQNGSRRRCATDLCCPTARGRGCFSAAWRSPRPRRRGRRRPDPRPGPVASPDD
jgi:hypothetical protein